MAKHNIPLADEEWIRNRPSNFTVPASVARLERDRLRREQQRAEQDNRKEGQDDG